MIEYDVSNEGFIILYPDGTKKTITKDDLYEIALFKKMQDEATLQGSWFRPYKKK